MASPSMQTSSSSAGRTLLLELKRHQGMAGNSSSSNSSSSSNRTTNATALPAPPPPYNLKLVRQCLDELQSSFERLSQEVQTMTPNEKPSMAARPSMLWHHACIQRQKRCLLAYHIHRVQQLTHMAASHPTMTTNTESWSSNGPELEFLQAYQTLRQSYVDTVLPDSIMSSGSGMMIPHATPPSSSMANSLQVRCLQTLGQVVLESGRSVTLTKGSVLYLPRQDVIEFLQDGTMQLLEGEEVDF